MNIRNAWRPTAAAAEATATTTPLAVVNQRNRLSGNSLYIFPIHIHTSANNQIFHLASSSSSFSSFCENFNGIVLTIEKFIIFPLIQHIFGIFPALNTFLSWNFSIHMYYADVNLIRCLIFQIIINTPFIFRILDDIQHIF